MSPIQLYEISAVYNLIAIVTMEHNNNPTTKQSKTIAVHGLKSCPQLTSLSLNYPKKLEDIGLKIIASRPP
jgi:hypothetical protein